ncbi:hypothetical protein [Nostoc sp. FACHB-888]|uniref:hypothetical protein n=1 Tax=Nostoc sp. FACHB-888 TaxID=2692842 RepID=UPI0016850A4E|nr:hypothetical protein [Nostoc sp. FACHB-888]MBD2249072.1 hypothetical protein [Nostoc sp. FACHB-888]
MPFSPDNFFNAVPPQRELLTLYYLLVRSQNRKTILKYNDESRSDRLILASVQQIMLGHLPEKEICTELVNSSARDSYFPSIWCNLLFL